MHNLKEDLCMMEWRIAESRPEEKDLYVLNTWVVCLENRRICVFRTRDIKGIVCSEHGTQKELCVLNTGFVGFWHRRIVCSEHRTQKNSCVLNTGIVGFWHTRICVFWTPDTEEFVCSEYRICRFWTPIDLYVLNTWFAQVSCETNPQKTPSPEILQPENRQYWKILGKET